MGSIADPQFRGGGPETCPYVVFSRSTVTLLPSRGRAEVCSPVNVNLLDVGDSYERKAVSSDGVHCDWIALSPSLLRDVVRDFAPELAERSASVFSRAVAPISARAFLMQREFFCATDALRHDTMALEESALLLVSTAVREAIQAFGALPAPGSRRNGCRQYELVEATKRILSEEYASDQSLSEISRRVHCSPAYLSRTFSRVVGYTLHEYKQQIRLRISLELLGERRFDGAGIAAHLGFASHSHFTTVFRRAFCITPGEFAKRASRRFQSALLKQLPRSRDASAAGDAEDR